ncbi:hypothetical protein EsH8_VIII_000207 [Colletotrichum jinshuiense]
MFRSWHYQPQPDYSWSTFSNVAGSRVNINNYNTYPRGPNGPPFVNPGPRLFDFAQLFNITNNFGSTPLRHDGPGRLRNRVTVVLADGSRVLVDRDVLHEHLPRTRSYMNRSLFPVPDFLRGYDHGFTGGLIDPQGFNDAFSHAATFIFRHLEGLCHSYASPYGAGGGSFDMFSRPRFLLANARNRAATVHEIFWHVFILCCVLDQDRALGCSEMLARPIAEFLLEFMPSVEAFLPPLAVQMMFLGYARIFRESRFELEVLRELWELMDNMDQIVIRNLMGSQLPANGMGSNVHRVWTALRHLGLV